jgi:AraC-like DNA-binding protein
MMMYTNGSIAAGYVSLAIEAAQQHHALGRSELLAAAGLDDGDLADPSTVLACDALWDVLQCVLDRTGDAGFGLRMAETFDLRTQGFWGYALLASLSLRQRIEIHLRYQQRRSPAEVTLRELGDAAILDVSLAPAPEQMRCMFLDWTFATVCLTHRARLGPGDPQLQLWLDVRERPHHAALRALAGGRAVFAAPCNRIQFPAAHLDLRLPGDPHLGKLARAQLDAQLDHARSTEQRDVRSAVRQRLLPRLAGDASLQSVARDLRLSVRTLRRRLSALGASFQDILEDLRRTTAISALARSDDSIEQIGARVGYPDPSNFRRAFRRWTGTSPRAFRARQRNHAPSRPPGSDKAASERVVAAEDPVRRRAR